METEKLLKLYSEDMPEFILAAAKTPEMQRLKNVGMNCGCEYTSFPRFKGIGAYSRFDHSLGVALIVWHFTGDRAQSLAGLFHDIATPTFAHVIDFLLGDHMRQEKTEGGTEKIIESSGEIQSLLSQLGLKTRDVSDYHIYPIADNDSPRLSADRLEYSLGNMLNYGIRSFPEAEGYYRDLVVSENEAGERELAFRSAEKAAGFARAALECSRVYVSDEDRYSMQTLAELVKAAADEGVIELSDIDGTEKELIAKLCGAEKFALRWQRFCAMEKMSVSNAETEGDPWRKIFAKKRYINPLAEGKGRLTELDADFSRELGEFISASQDYWIKGE